MDRVATLITVASGLATILGVWLAWFTLSDLQKQQVLAFFRARLTGPLRSAWASTGDALGGAWRSTTTVRSAYLIFAVLLITGLVGIAVAVGPLRSVVKANPGSTPIAPVKWPAEPEPVTSAPSLPTATPTRPSSTPRAPLGSTFEAKGLAVIELRDGTQRRVPANCVAFRNYDKVLLGLVSGTAYGGRPDRMISFTGMKTFSLSGASNVSTLTAAIDLLDGSKESKVLNSSDTLLAAAGEEGLAFGVPEVRRVTFVDFSRKAGSVALALVKTKSGGTYSVPAKMLFLRETSVGMGGVGTDWRDSLPLSSGNDLSIALVRKLQVLKATSGWDQKIDARILLRDGRVLSEVISSGSSAFSLVGLNNLGVFNLDLGEPALDSVAFLD
jgi:hypothetical protein